MWTYNSVFYQIYPIGFCGAPVHNDGITVPRIRKIIEWSIIFWTVSASGLILLTSMDSDLMLHTAWTANL